MVKHTQTICKKTVRLTIILSIENSNLHASYKSTLNKQLWQQLSKILSILLLVEEILFAIYLQLCYLSM